MYCPFLDLFLVGLVLLCLVSFDTQGFSRGLARADVNADAVNLGSVGDGIDDNGDSSWKDGGFEEGGLNEEGEEARSRRENGMGDLLQAAHYYSLR